MLDNLYMDNGSSTYDNLIHNLSKWTLVSYKSNNKNIIKIKFNQWQWKLIDINQIFHAYNSEYDEGINLIFTNGFYNIYCDVLHEFKNKSITLFVRNNITSLEFEGIIVNKTDFKQIIHSMFNGNIKYVQYVASVVKYMFVIKYGYIIFNNCKFIMHILINLLKHQIKHIDTYDEKNNSRNIVHIFTTEYSHEYHTKILSYSFIEIRYKVTPQRLLKYKRKGIIIFTEDTEIFENSILDRQIKIVQSNPKFLQPDMDIINDDLLIDFICWFTNADYTDINYTS
jgi:hypothetical protein